MVKGFMFLLKYIEYLKPQVFHKLLPFCGFRIYAVGFFSSQQLDEVNQCCLDTVHWNKVLSYKATLPPKKIWMVNSFHISWNINHKISGWVWQFFGNGHDFLSTKPPSLIRWDVGFRPATGLLHLQPSETQPLKVWRWVRVRFSAFFVCRSLERFFFFCMHQIWPSKMWWRAFWRRVGLKYSCTRGSLWVSWAFFGSHKSWEVAQLLWLPWIVARKPFRPDVGELDILDHRNRVGMYILESWQGYQNDVLEKRHSF